MTNSLTERVESGKPVFGADARTFSPTIIEVYGKLGFDYVWLDFEHAGPNPADSHMLEGLARTADNVDVELLVRIPSADPALIRKVLDTGIRTLLIPQVRSAEEARDAVEAAQFSYGKEPGRRGAGLARSSDWGLDFRDPDERDRDVLVGAMIENDAAVSGIDEILSVPGLGFVFMGPADLSVSLGAPFESDSDEVQDRLDHVLDRAVEADVPIGQTFAGKEEARQAVADGYRIITLGNEVNAIVETLADRLTAVRE